jgi:hypothetical protein
MPSFLSFGFKDPESNAPDSKCFASRARARSLAAKAAAAVALKAAAAKK